jgi:hypothetical protein
MHMVEMTRLRWITDRGYDTNGFGSSSKTGWMMFRGEVVDVINSGNGYTTTMKEH